MKRFLVLGLILVLFGSCSDDFEEGDSFFHVFNDEVAQAKYMPESVAITSSGYMMLSAKGEWTPHVVWMDASGNLDGSWEAPQGVIHPASGIVSLGGVPHFMCMDQVTLQPILFAAPSAGQVVEIGRLSGGQYPLCFGSDANENPFLVAYERQSRRTMFYQLNASGAVTGIKGFNNLQEIDDLVLAHIKRQKVYPFFAGALPGGGYYFNGLVNYSYSFLFIDQELNQQALYQGTQYKGGVAAALPLGEGWAVHRYLNNEMYFDFPVSVATSGIFTAQNLGGGLKFDWMPGTPVRFKSHSLDGKSYLLVGYTGTDAQMHLSVLSSSGQELGTFDLGQGAPARLADMAIDQDGGVVLCGSFTVAGQFVRPGLFKLDYNELRLLAGLEEEES